MSMNQEHLIALISLPLGLGFQSWSWNEPAMLDVALCKNNTAELEAELTNVTVWNLVLGGIFQSISII